ncbi:calcium-dependent protein kinase 17-like [Stylonychia lemnae]|uniref:Calcium-dependent protein kinase 17-like n=1 Tax=Stylonychia lemnae TaxID=5949 RepID=A0A078A2D1_STYLE|nr:calcium-dependent protein kinase 17-like [Stylonychia lemnae]|eukprot:CDW75977.1 calcium-dependent protein kinase 17-like [Stylonychia lemnae]
MFYIPPEVRNEHVYGYKSDLWSLGILLFLMLSGNLPFDNTDDLENNYYEDQFEKAKDFIDHLLEGSYEERFSAYEALNHPWIVENSPPPDINLNQDQDDELQQELEFQERLRQAMNKKRQESSRNTFGQKENNHQSSLQIELLRQPQSNIVRNDLSVINNTQINNQNIRNTLGSNMQVQANNFDRRIKPSANLLQKDTAIGDMSKLRTKILTIHKKISQIYVKTLFQEIDDDDDDQINKHDVHRYLKIPCHKAEELFSYGDSKEPGKLDFFEFVNAMRSQLENDLIEWFKMVIGDESLPLVLEDFKIILSESKFFPISDDLNELFKELNLYIKKKSSLVEEKSEKIVDHNKHIISAKMRKDITMSEDKGDIDDSDDSSIARDFHPNNTGNLTNQFHRAFTVNQSRTAVDTTSDMQKSQFVYAEFITYLMKMGGEAIKQLKK